MWNVIWVCFVVFVLALLVVVGIALTTSNRD